MILGLINNSLSARRLSRRLQRIRERLLHLNREVDREIFCMERSRDTEAEREGESLQMSIIKK